MASSSLWLRSPTAAPSCFANRRAKACTHHHCRAAEAAEGQHRRQIVGHVLKGPEARVIFHCHRSPPDRRRRCEVSSATSRCTVIHIDTETAMPPSKTTQGSPPAPGFVAFRSRDPRRWRSASAWLVGYGYAPQLTPGRRLEARAEFRASVSGQICRAPRRTESSHRLGTASGRCPSLLTVDTPLQRMRKNAASKGRRTAVSSGSPMAEQGTSATRVPFRE